jgi:hypothetical protein
MSGVNDDTAILKVVSKKLKEAKSMLINAGYDEAGNPTWCESLTTITTQIDEETDFFAGIK